MLQGPVNQWIKDALFLLLISWNVLGNTESNIPVNLAATIAKHKKAARQLPGFFEFRSGKFAVFAKAA